MRRQTTRSTLRRVLCAALLILLVFLVYQWLYGGSKRNQTKGDRDEMFSLLYVTLCGSEIRLRYYLLPLMLFSCGLRAEIPYARMDPFVLLKRDLENFNCLFNQRNCSNQFFDFSSTDQSVWKISQGVPTVPKLNKVSLELYMEAQCPDTSRFIHKQLMKAWSMLSHTGRVELTVIPFGKARCVATAGNDFSCTCQHGVNECILNQLMNCVIERLGFPDRIIPIIDCIQGRPDLNDAMNSCVTNNAFLDYKWLKKCATGPHGRRLLAMAGSRTASLSPALDFVPWIIIDGERNADAFYDLTENLCNKLEPVPDECLVYTKNLKGQQDVPV